MSELAKTIDLLRARRGGEMPPETAHFIIMYTRLLAKGRPVSAQQLAHELGDPVEFITTAFHQMKQNGAEFNDKGELVGAAITLTPTKHRFSANGIQLYAWCALDTMFLPAYIGANATVTSTCPVTDTTITMTITPNRIKSILPEETVLSIMTAAGCSAGLEGTFCNQVNFFASRDAARKWIGKRADFSILTAMESYQLAKTIYIEPVLKHIE